MYKKILVPVDGSPNSECVMGHVKAVASGCQVPEVVLFFVVEPMNPRVYDIPPDFLEGLIKKNTEDAKNYVTRIGNELNQDGIFTTTAVAQGNPAEVILDFAQANGVDLIVMSTHGRSGVTRWAIGSVTDRVVRESLVPVLIVSPPGCRTEIK